LQRRNARTANRMKKVACMSIQKIQIETIITAERCGLVRTETVSVIVCTVSSSTISLLLMKRRIRTHTHTHTWGPRIYTHTLLPGASGPSTATAPESSCITPNAAPIPHKTIHLFAPRERDEQVYNLCGGVTLGRMHLLSGRGARPGGPREQGR
jgi:hypothetical protein